MMVGNVEAMRNKVECDKSQSKKVGRSILLCWAALE